MSAKEIETARNKQIFSSKTNSTVIMISGGIDSTVLAYKLANDKRYDSISAFFANLGVPNSVEEYNAVNRVCHTLGFRLVEADFSWMSKALGGIIPAYERDPRLNEPALAEQSVKALPITLSCVIFAETIGCSDMFIGLNKDDLPGNEFVLPILQKTYPEIATLANSKKTFSIHTPWVELTGDKVLEEGVRLGVPFEDTWSCVAETYVHCGVCKLCLKRKERFKRYIQRNPDFKDPTVYLN